MSDNKSYKYSNKEWKNVIYEYRRLLFEQEEEVEEEEVEEEPAVGLFDDPEPAPAEPAEEVEQVEVETEVEEKYIPQSYEEESSIDSVITRFLIDAEAAAIKIRKSEDEMYENLNTVLALLLEQETDLTISDINMEKFAAEVVRLVKNYDALLNIPEIIVNKTIEFLNDKYGEEGVSEFEDILDSQYGMALEDTQETLPSDPLAIGSFVGGGGV